MPNRATVCAKNQSQRAARERIVVHEQGCLVTRRAALPPLTSADEPLQVQTWSWNKQVHVSGPCGCAIETCWERPRAPPYQQMHPGAQWSVWLLLQMRHGVGHWCGLPHTFACVLCPSQACVPGFRALLRAAARRRVNSASGKPRWSAQDHTDAMRAETRQIRAYAAPGVGPCALGRPDANEDSGSRPGRGRGHTDTELRGCEVLGIAVARD